MAPKLITDRLGAGEETTNAETSQESQKPVPSAHPAENEDQPGTTVVPPASYPEFYQEEEEEGPGWLDWLFGPELAPNLAPNKADRPDALPRETIRQKIPKNPLTIKLYRGTIGEQSDGKEFKKVYAELNLRALIDDSEKAIQQLVAEIQLNGPTPPPTPEADEEDDEETPGISQLIEEVRDNLRKQKKSKIELTDAHTQRLNEIIAEVARVVYSTEKKIQDEVAEINQVLEAYDDGKGPPVTIADARTAVQTGHKNIEGHVEEGHKKQEALAERVKELARDAAKIADEAKSGNAKPDSNSAEKNIDKKTGGGDETGGGGKKHYDQIPPPGKEDSALIGDGDEDAEDDEAEDDDAEDDEDRNADVKKQEAQQGETKEQPSSLEKLMTLVAPFVPFAMAGIAAMGPVVGMAGPAMTAAAQREEFERERRDEEEDEDDEDGAQERSDVASAEPPPPPPGADPKVANLGGTQVHTNSPAAAEAVRKAFYDKDDALKGDGNSPQRDPAQLDSGDVAKWENGEARLAKMPDGLKIVSNGQLLPFDPHNPPGDYGKFLGYGHPPRFDVQVAAAPPPPGQTVIV